jgi:hypothetical protein
MEICPAEGLMLKAPVAPFSLMVSCSKSRITVDAGRCTQCRPSNVYREVDEADPRKKKTTSSREDAPQKYDRPHTLEKVSRCKRRFRRSALPKTPCAQRMRRGVLGCNWTGGILTHKARGKRKTGGKVMPGRLERQISWSDYE